MLYRVLVCLDVNFIRKVIDEDYISIYNYINFF